MLEEQVPPAFLAHQMPALSYEREPGSPQPEMGLAATPERGRLTSSYILENANTLILAA